VKSLRQPVDERCESDRIERPYAAANLAAEYDALNLGSGADYRAEMCNVDYNDRYDPDVVHDLNEPWPFPDASFERVLASHVFEHLDELDHAFAEAGRVLVDGGALEVHVPIGVNARTDWTHQHEFTYDTPLQFAQNWRAHTDDYQFDPTAPFDLVGRELSMVCHGPFRVCSPLVARAARTMPGVWTSAVPASSGELIARFRRRDR